MKVLILGLNYAPEPVGIGPYTAEMAEALVSMGHEVEVIAAKPYYPQWQTDPSFAGSNFKRKSENGVTVTRIPIYVPIRPSGLRRILHHLSFAASALWPICRAARRFKPDLVWTVAPSLLGVPIGRLAANIARAPLWLHVQDLEVEAAFATGLLARESLAGRIAVQVEKHTLAAANQISAISPQMCAKIRAKCQVPVVEFRNWARIDEVKPLTGRSPYRDEWSLGEAHVALYSGNIANKQGIEIVVAAARILSSRSDIMFVICGEGPNRTSLVSSASDLPNIRFYDLQPKERLGDLLGLASVHLLPQLADAADLVLPSKLTNMLASGRPVVAIAAAGTGLAMEVDGCGVITSPGDAAAFAAGIVETVDHVTQRETWGAVARARAVERWSHDGILRRFVEDIRQLISGKTRIANKGLLDFRDGTSL